LWQARGRVLFGRHGGFIALPDAVSTDIARGARARGQMKVSIVGVGKVGSTLAFALLSQGLVDHLVLVGREVSHAEGEASDLRHSLAFLRHPAKVEAGDLARTADSDVIVLSASCPSPKGQI